MGMGSPSHVGGCRFVKRRVVAILGALVIVLGGCSPSTSTSRPTDTTASPPTAETPSPVAAETSGSAPSASAAASETVAGFAIVAPQDGAAVT